MRDTQLFIMDLTGQPARFGLAATSGPPHLELLPELSVPWRVAFQLDEKNERLRAFAGNEAPDVKEDERTLVVEDVQSNLPLIEDQELRFTLFKELWRAVADTLSQSEREPVVYVIPPYSYSNSLLEEMREASLTDERVRLGGFIHEAASLLVGVIQSGIFAELTAGLNLTEPQTLALIAAHDNGSVAVACFDYSLDSEDVHHLSIRDYFQTSSYQLRARLENCDWLDRFAKLFLLVSPGGDPQTARELFESLRAFDLDVAGTWRESPELATLKMAGAAHLARCCSGKGDEGRYLLDIAYHVGVQVEQNRFHPILIKDEVARLREYPHTVAQVLQVQGDPGNELRLNLYCGQSDYTGDGVLLGRFSLSRQDLRADSLLETSPLALFITMKTPGSGEITLGLLSQDKVVGSIPFTLPALVV